MSNKNSNAIRKVDKRDTSINSDSEMTVYKNAIQKHNSSSSEEGLNISDEICCHPEALIKCISTGTPKENDRCTSQAERTEHDWREELPGP